MNLFSLIDSTKKYSKYCEALNYYVTPKSNRKEKSCDTLAFGKGCKINDKENPAAELYFVFSAHLSL